MQLTYCTAHLCLSLPCPPGRTLTLPCVALSGGQEFQQQPPAYLFVSTTQGVKVGMSATWYLHSRDKDGTGIGQPATDTDAEDQGGEQSTTIAVLVDTSDWRVDGEEGWARAMGVNALWAGGSKKRNTDALDTYLPTYFGLGKVLVGYNGQVKDFCRRRRSLPPLQYQLPVVPYLPT
ncbi:uncharacterized protein LY79DRAFT_575901 [Colletotrichum navitas]|uniref:Uncharacterized protein n=1 Tax=Colletotrichum navitas TaxID=681940 RepID=A0AAD8QA02_9PEZI|nr:uncharacterized protein LY79DRAFT_575901 [Colletotrichum navitas]KAK1598755.1 hypothetical protein LY79DRAFT_575901 [Colletotrichum navitas]